TSRSMAARAAARTPAMEASEPTSRMHDAASPTAAGAARVAKGWRPGLRMAGPGASGRGLVFLVWELGLELGDGLVGASAVVGGESLGPALRADVGGRVGALAPIVRVGQAELAGHGFAVAQEPDDLEDVGPGGEHAVVG